MSYLDEHETFHDSALYGPALECEDCAWEVRDAAERERQETDETEKEDLE